MENVKRDAETLLLLLEEERGLVGKLLAFAQEKEQRLSREDAEGLSGVLAQEEDTAAALCEKEKEREKGTKALAALLRLPRENPTLRELAGCIGDAEYARRLTDAGVEVRRMVRALSRQNARVRGLLEHRVRYTDFMLGLLLGIRTGTHFYNGQGSREEQRGFASRLDYHA